MKSKVRDIGMLTFGKGINLLVNILFMPYMARALSYNMYGTYGQTLFITALVTAILTFGLPKIIYVFLSEEEYNQKDVLSSNLFGAGIVSVIGVVIVISLSHFLSVYLNNEQLVLYLNIFAFSILFSLMNSVINSYLIYDDRVKESITIIVIVNIIKIGLVVASIQLYQSLTLAFFSIIFSMILQFLAGVFLVRKKLVFPQIKLTKKQMQMGLPLGLVGMIGIALLYTDSFMVSRILGVKEYAIYRNGAIEVPFIATIYGSIAAIILPAVTKLWGSDNINEIIRLKRKAIMNTIYIIYPVLFFMLYNSYDVITLLMGMKYESSAIIFAIFNLTLLVRVNNYSDVLIASKNSNYILITFCIAFLINIILNYILISSFGAVGAAISTVISIALLALIQFVKTLSLLNARLRQLVSIRNILLTILISSLLAFILHFIVSFVRLHIFRLLIFALAYFPVVYLFLLKRNYIDKSILEQLLPKKLKFILKWV